MDDPVAVTRYRAVAAFVRLSARCVDALSSAIAGFALLAGARAFMFTALLGWREPVLGGAGLVVLALVGWLRWRCGAAACAAIAGEHGGCAAAHRVDGSGRGTLSCSARRPPRCACYNRSKQGGRSGPAESSFDS